MATHSSVLASRILWTEEPGRLLSIGLHKVRHDGSDLACMHWRTEWQPTPVFLPGESQEQRILVGCPLWVRTESGTTEATAAAAAPIYILTKSVGQLPFLHTLSSIYYL